MTIELSGWMLPALITALGWLPAANYRAGDYDPGGAILGAAWLLGSSVAWLVYVSTLLVGGV